MLDLIIGKRGHLAVILLVGLILLIFNQGADKSVQSESIKNDDICATKENDEFNQLLVKKSEESSDEDLCLNTSGISFLPAFAFQCNYNFKQTEYKRNLKIYLEQDLELNEDAFRASDGRVKSNWMNTSIALIFFTNGYKLKFGDNTFGRYISWNT
eukprot:snap_masked-scaffold_32-processed-gene-0.8-mRNA-1 protein AED:1.00 eAED:1.00 QI:0/0/0/0/1/1/2/0/155